MTTQVVLLSNGTLDVYTSRLREEAHRIQDGIIREGQVAADALPAIARLQDGR